MLLPKGETEPRQLCSPMGAAITTLVPLSDLIAAASFDSAVQRQRIRDLIQFSMEMHEFMRDEAEVSEQEKPLAVAGSLIALGNDVFRQTYDKYPADELPAFWMQSIKKEITKAKLPVAKVDNMTQPFTNIEVQPSRSRVACSSSFAVRLSGRASKEAESCWGGFGSGLFSGASSNLAV
jgi:type I restriction enzyme M protein